MLRYVRRGAPPMNATMCPVTPTGRWGKDKEVSCNILSYNAKYLRLQVTDDAGKSFILKVPQSLVTKMAETQGRAK